MKKRTLITLSLLVLGTAGRAQDTNATFTSETDKVSYAIGYNIGMNLQRQGFDVDPAIIERGLRDLLDGNTPAMTEIEAREVLGAYQQKLRQQKLAEQAAAAAQNKEEGLAWLAENATKEGVVTLESGLQYKVLTAGDGESPGATDTVVMHYRVTLIDGTEFDSTLGRKTPAQLKANSVIRGWSEALQMMKSGDKWQLFIPSDLAYGDRAYGTIKPGSTLIVEVELVDVIKPQPITSDIIRVPSAEEMEKGAKIETIKASDLKRIEEEAKKAQEQK